MANMDYSKSAVNLTNPVQLQVDLRALAGLTSQIQELQAKMDACIPQELITLMESLQTQRQGCETGLRSDIETYGSYQDITVGDYAVKQRKVSISYDPQVFRAQYPDYAPAVIKETIDSTKLNGLIKGGLLTPEDLEKKGVSSKSETFAYIIKTG